MSGAHADDGGRGVLDGAFRWLDRLCEVGDAGLTALAAGRGLPKATAHRLLDQLVRLGAVERADTRYRVGPRLFQLGQAWEPHPGLRSTATQPLHELARATGASVGLCVLRAGRALVVSGVPGEIDELVPLRAGATWGFPTAVGKALAAGLAPLARESASWQREAALIRDRGIALDHEQAVPGVACAAVPIRARDGRSVAAVCAMIEASPRLPRIAEVLRRVGRAISAGLEPG